MKKKTTKKKIAKKRPNAKWQPAAPPETPAPRPDTRLRDLAALEASDRAETLRTSPELLRLTLQKNILANYQRLQEIIEDPETPNPLKLKAITEQAKVSAQLIEALKPTQQEESRRRRATPAQVEVDPGTEERIRRDLADRHQQLEREFLEGEAERQVSRKEREAVREMSRGERDAVVEEDLE